jgi:ornithine carbamoyltransferase
MKNAFRGKDFLTLADYSKEEINYILDASADLKQKLARREPHEYLKGRKIALLFEKPSTRTRVSFQAAIADLGATDFYMRPTELQLGRGEPVKDTARVFDRYCDGLVIRTFEQSTVEEFAHYMENPVINALTNQTHPCQLLADLLTIREKRGTLEGLKIVYAGVFPWNVGNSWLIVGAKYGMDVTIVSPEGYEADPGIMEKAQREAAGTGARLSVMHDLHSAVEMADVVYTVTWYGMGQEDIIEKIKKDWADFQITHDVLKAAKDDVLYMHCLPAHRGEEVTDEVLEGPYSVVWDEAENRMHTEKALLNLLIL